MFGLFLSKNGSVDAQSRFFYPPQYVIKGYKILLIYA